MYHSLLDLAYRLTQAGEPFVLATVVWCERPTSAKPGAQAIIQADGQLSGWVGGSCTQPVVLREARRILSEGGEPCLLRLGAPDTGMARNGVRVFPMTCSSSGALDIYMEPHLPRPQLLLIGDSPVIVALSRLAPVLDFAVTQLAHADLSAVTVNEQTYILVATHGQYDEDALEQALRTPARYIGMVGSRRRAESCRVYLRDTGLTEPQIARLKAPAGLDLGAITPEEIAASILAELVQVKRHGPLQVTQEDSAVHQGAEFQRSSTEEHGGGRMTEGGDVVAELASAMPPPMGEEGGGMGEVDGGMAEASSATTLMDPVCHMVVDRATARHRSRLGGREFYFCCPACKRSFERNPQEYLAQET